MAPFFTQPPEVPPEELDAPRIVPPEAALARTVSTLLMLCWVWWWWNGFDRGAYWIIAAAIIFVTGETMPHLYRPFLPLWWPMRIVVRPVTAVLLAITRRVIPEAYRRPQRVLKPLSLDEINEALDEAAGRKDPKDRERGPD